MEKVINILYNNRIKVNELTLGDIMIKNNSKLLKNKILKKPIPKHIAIILDGNGRWAKKRRLPRNMGHREGAKNLTEIMRKCNDLGVKVLTVYAFSTENWKRPKEEVEYLMKMPIEYFDKTLPKVIKENVKVSFIGDISGVPVELQNKVSEVIDSTKDNTGLHFVIALNYGSQDEIINATKNITRKVIENKLNIEDINGAVFESELYTKNLPKIDLMIRTSGEIRLSNFLLWQLAYSEFYFTKVLWPDFKEIELYKAIDEYQSRNRRYGGLKDDKK